MFAKFFIDRPRFAMVISILLGLAGIIAAFSLPVEQYPNVTPPQIQVSASYRGAAADVAASVTAASAPIGGSAIGSSREGWPGAAVTGAEAPSTGR